MSNNKLCIIGAGFIGTTLGLHIIKFGYTVTIVDIDKNKIEKFNNKEKVINETGIQPLIDNAIDQGNLIFTHDLTDLKFNTIILAIPFNPNVSLDISTQNYTSAIKDLIHIAENNSLS